MEEAGAVTNPLERHLTTFVGAMYRHVRRAIWSMLRTGLLAFAAVAVVGGAALTATDLALGTTPLRPLALVGYAVLAFAALTTAAAAMAVHLSLAVLRGIEHAAKDVLEEVERLEVEARRAVVHAAPFGRGDDRTIRPPSDTPGGR
jgi:hypothetical protein